MTRLPALVAAALAAAVVGGCSTAGPPASVRDSVGALRAADGVRAVPRSFAQGDPSLNAEDTRLVRVSATSRQYLTTNDRGEICLVSELLTDPRGPVSGSSCAAPAAFEERGLPVVVSAAGGVVAAIAVPDRYARVLGAGGPEPVERNVVVLESASADELPSTLDFELNDGATHAHPPPPHRHTLTACRQPRAVRVGGSGNVAVRRQEPRQRDGARRTGGEDERRHPGRDRPGKGQAPASTSPRPGNQRAAPSSPDSSGSTTRRSAVASTKAPSWLRSSAPNPTPRTPAGWVTIAGMHAVEQGEGEESREEPEDRRDADDLPEFCGDLTPHRWLSESVNWRNRAALSRHLAQEIAQPADPRPVRAEKPVT